MRIALVSLHTSPSETPGRGDAGGLNVVVAAAVKVLAARDHDVTVVTRASDVVGPGEYPLDSYSSNTTSHPNRSSTQAPANAPRLIALAAGALNLRKNELHTALPEFSRELLRLGTFDAVHAHYWLSGLAAGPLAAASNVIPALTLHTVATQKNARLAARDTAEPAQRVAAERALCRSSFVIATSHSELAAIEAGYGGEPGSPSQGTAVIHPGVDTELFRPRDSAVATDRRLRITVLGRVQPLKGQDLAVRAAAQLAQQDPELWARCELVIAGESTPGAEAYAAELRTLAEQLGISSQVRFLPAQDRAESAELLASSALVLVPSHSETFGLVALEASACGVPTIVGAHTGLVESAPAGMSGLQVAERDPAAWARAMRSLLLDPERRHDISRTAREYALRHNWGAHAAQLERVYAKLPHKLMRNSRAKSL